MLSEDVSQSVHLVVGEGLEAYLPLADMVDISAEVQRLSKRLSKMQIEYDTLVARLSSPKVRILLLLLFISKHVFVPCMRMCHTNILTSRSQLT